MKDTELRQEKDREIYSIYVRGIREHDFASLEAAADWVRSQPASKFYISPKALLNSITAIERGTKTKNRFRANDTKLRILYGMYLNYLAQNPTNKMSKERICEILSEMPAPRFFICQESCLDAINRERSRIRKEIEIQNQR